VGSPNRESVTFPVGDPLFSEMASVCVLGEPLTWSYWIHLGEAEFPFVLCWEDFTALDSVDSEIRRSETVKCAFRRWATWHYFREGARAERLAVKELGDLGFTVDELYAEIRQACQFAPKPVLERVGNLSKFRDWPRALLYLAAKGVNPRLFAKPLHIEREPEGLPHRTEQDSPLDDSAEEEPHQELAFNELNDWVIQLLPENVSVATSLAFDFFRHVVSTNGEPSPTIGPASTETNVQSHSGDGESPQRSSGQQPTEPAGDPRTSPEGHVKASDSTPEHSDDFRSVNWYGKGYTFTPLQAACVKVLWENWGRRVPELSEATILEHADSFQKHLRGVFRISAKGKKTNHEALDVMIVSGSRKGTFRLAGKNP